MFTAAALLALAGCVPSPLYVPRPHRHSSNGDIPRDARGEPVWSEIRAPATVPVPPPPMAAPQGVPITPPPAFALPVAEATPALTATGTPVVRTVTTERRIVTVRRLHHRHGHRHHRHRHTIIHTRTVTTIR